MHIRDSSLTTLSRLALAALLLAASTPARAQDPSPPAGGGGHAQGRITVRAVRVATPPNVDGLLDEPVYQSLAPITGFIQQDPDEGQPATEATLVWITFDDRAIYIAARARDSQPSRIVANDMRRDGRNVSQNDNLSIVLDTFHDGRNAYEFLTNAVGGMLDTQITDERDVNRDWNATWIERSRRDAEGWTVEMAIPFRSLRYRGSGPQVWGINIRRNVRWKNELSYLSPVPRLSGPRGILRISQAANLEGLETPPPALNLDFKPYVVGNLKADRASDAAFRNRLERNAGFDLKYGVTPSLTADVTFRTDFAQVEDDDQQVNLTRFNLLFPEKREFFLEGQGTFAFGGASTTPPTGTLTSVTSVPLNTPVLFFSRRIGLSGTRAVPIEGGARLTGKAGRYTLGLLDIQTGDAPLGGQPSTNFSVVRVKRDILRRSYIGVIGTRRSPTTVSGRAGDNGVFGLDANFSFFKNLNLVGYYAGSDTAGRGGRSYRARVDYDADLFGFQAERLMVGAGFNPESGFLRRADFGEEIAQIRISRRPAHWRGVRKVNYEAGLDYLANGAGRLENRQTRAVLRTEMQSGDSWSVGYFHDFELISTAFPLASATVAPGAYRAPTVRAAYMLGTQRRVSGELSTARGGFYGGTRTDVGYRGRAEITHQLSLEPGLSFNRVELPASRFTATLASVRASLSFTPRMLTAAFIQYNSTSRLVTTNVRFRWEYVPGSELFLVYSDGRDTFGRGFPVLTNRGLTLKLTRLLRP
ncbi:MAG: DUF5916 domain-containing protein [Acidobacteriota bacterium]